MLNNFIREIGENISANEPEPSLIITLKNLMRIYMSIDDFRLDCIEAQISSIEKHQRESKVWRCPEIYINNELNLRIRLIHWPAFYENNPHMHKTWGITGVFSGTVNVYTYDTEEDARSRTISKMIVGGEKMCGYIMPTHIHNIYNPIGRVSTTLHIFNQDEGSSHNIENATWFPAPRADKLLNGLQNRTIESFLYVLSGFNCERSTKLLQRMLGLNNHDQHGKIIYIISQRDLDNAQRLLKQYSERKIYAKV